MGMEEDVKEYEQCASEDNQLGLCERSTAAVPKKMGGEREVSWDWLWGEQTDWLLEEFKRRRRNPGSHSEVMAIDGSLRGVVGIFAACGWAVMQVDLGGGIEPWYGMCGIMPVELEVQRTLKRAEMWALLMALRRHEGLAEISTDKLGGVQAFWDGEVSCVFADHTGADLWVHVRDKTHEVIEERWDLWWSGLKRTP